MNNYSLINKSVILAIILIICHVLSAESSCDPVDKDRPSCQCKTEKGFTVDLAKVFDDVKTPSTPLFSKTQQTYKYGFQPCKPFSCGGKEGAAACQSPPSGTEYTIGIQSNAKFTGSIYDDSLQLVYEGEPDSMTQKKRHTFIQLKCNKHDTLFDAAGETSTLNYTFTLHTPRVCPPKGLSTGSILLIVFFVLAFVYLVGGILFLRFVRGARGVEMIPNLEFWKDLPSLVKDGFLFVSRGCKTDPTYNQI